MSILNKYTLKYRQTSLEEQYIEQRNSRIKMPIFQVGSTSIFVMAMNKLIQVILNEEYNKVYVLLACQLFTIISLILLRYKIHKINLQLIILCYLLIGYEQTFNSDISRGGLQLYLTNSSYCILIIILSSEFMDSIIIIISASTFRMIYTIVVENEKSYALHIATIACTIFLCYFSYKINSLSRTNFLLIQQDDMWDKIFPQVMDRPYMIFQFNEEKLQFILKSTNNLNFECQNSEQLKRFLRDWRFQSNSLESLFYLNLINFQQQEIFSDFIEIENLKRQKLLIKFTIFKVISSSIILSFQEKYIHKSDHKNVITKLYTVQQKLQQNLVKFMFKNLKNGLKKDNKAKLTALLYSCYQQLLSYRIKHYKLKIRPINQNDFKELKELFQTKNLQVSVQTNIQNSPKFVVLYFKYLIFEIFKNTIKNTTIQIIFDEKPIIAYQGKSINFHKNEILRMIWNTSIENQSLIGNFITFFFYNEPNIKF